MLGFSFYFIATEYLKYRYSGTINSLLQLCFNLFVVFAYIVDIANTNIFSREDGLHKIDYAVPVGSLLIVLSYFMLILQLRYFEAFAVFINLIYYAFKDTISFVTLVLITLSGFANALFILSMIEQPDTGDDKISGPNLFTSLMTTGEGHVYHAGHLHYPYVWGIFQGLLSMIVSTILLKTLVSILEHIHSHVAGLYTSERLKSKCRLINENAYIFSRGEVFKDTKYVIRVESSDSGHHAADEHGGSVHGGGGHGGGLNEKQIETIVETINSNFKMSLKQECDKLHSGLKSLKTMINQIDAKFSEIDGKSND